MDTGIRQCAAVGNKLMADFQMPELKLQFAARGEPVGSPRLYTLAFPTHPIPHQLAMIRKS